MRPIDYFLRSVKKSPATVFLDDGVTKHTYLDAEKRIIRLSNSLHGSGFIVGDSVAVYSPNSADAMLCIFSAIYAGGAWVPVNIRNSVSTNAQYMAYVKTKWLFFHSSLLDQIGDVVSQLPDLESAFCIDGPVEGYESLSDFSRDASEVSVLDWSDPSSRPDHVFSRWPTGGTTGPSKGVEMTNQNIITMFELGIKHYVDSFEGLVVHLAVAPITHAAGLMTSIFSAVSGTTIIQESFEPIEVLKAIEKHRVTHIFFPPTAYYALLDSAKSSTFDLSSLKQILIAAAPVSPAKLKEGIEVFGPVVCQCYGQAEAPMLISMLSPTVLADAVKGKYSERVFSCGEVTSCTDVAILDDDGRRLPIGEKGEICCRGPLVTPGYFEKASATSDVRKYGWHHTGDIGYLDEYNFLYIVDRKKDMIITGGFNVFATEVEAPILEIEEVLECAVIGVPDERWGEKVTAIVVLKVPGSISEENIIEVIKPKLGSVKTPKTIQFWNSIPKTAVGKTDKKLIREEFWKDNNRLIN